MVDRPVHSGHTLTYVLMLVGVLIWGGNWVAAKLALGLVPPITLATLRYAVATPVLLVFLRTQGPLPRVERRDWPALVGLGVLFGVVSNLLFLYGLQLAPPTDGAIVYPGFQPAFATLFAALVLGEAVGGRQLTGLGICFAGLVLVLGSGLGEAGGALRLVGDLMFLVGSLVWAYTNVLVRVLTPRLSPLAATTYGAVICLPALFLLSFTESAWATLPSTIPAIWPALGYMTVVSTGPPTVFFYMGIQRLGVARASAFSYLVPVSGVAFTVLLLHERLLALQVGGGLAVLGGLWLISRRRAAAALALPRAARQGLGS